MAICGCLFLSVNFVLQSSHCTENKSFHNILDVSENITTAYSCVTTMDQTVRLLLFVVSEDKLVVCVPSKTAQGATIPFSEEGFFSGKNYIVSVKFYFCKSTFTRKMQHNNNNKIIKNNTMTLKLSTRLFVIKLKKGY